MRQHQIDPSLRELQASLDQAKLRHAASMTIAEKLRMGADLLDECIQVCRPCFQGLFGCCRSAIVSDRELAPEQRKPPD
jgi:hypothetical protein